MKKDNEFKLDHFLAVFFGASILSGMFLSVPTSLIMGFIVALIIKLNLRTKGE